MKDKDKETLILPKNTVVATWNEEEGYSLYLPNTLDDDDEVPPKALALVSALLRLDSDPEFREECIRDFHMKKRMAS